MSNDSSCLPKKATEQVIQRRTCSPGVEAQGAAIREGENTVSIHIEKSKLSARVVFLLFTITIIATQAFANSRAVNLAEMTSTAGRIVHGKVVEIREGQHPKNEQMAVTFVKVEVTEMLKGESAREVTFMQFGSSHQQYVAHLPKYSVGEEVVLFLYPESKLGLTSPVGEGQGKFVVRDDVRTGKRVLRNEQLNRSLFARLDTAKVNTKLALNKAERETVAQSDNQAREGMEFSSFRSIVRKMKAVSSVNLQ